MKSCDYTVIDLETTVAPPVGAWVEISRGYVFPPWSGVAPPVGAWVEIFVDVVGYRFYKVAPPVGAWVEMECPEIFL